MKDFFATVLGGGIWSFLIIILYLLILFPFYMMGLPFWLTIIFTVIIFIVNDVISGIIQNIAWIVGLIFTIINPQNWLSIIYYIAFSIVVAPTFLRLIKAIRYK